MNILDFIKTLQDNTSGDITINININGTDVPADDVVDEPVAETPDTDFNLGDTVLVCHVRKSGERVHTVGEVIEVLGHDDKGWYTRVLGSNGKHYRAGLKFNEERLGTIIYTIE